MKAQYVKHNVQMENMLISIPINALHAFSLAITVILNKVALIVLLILL